MRKIVVNGLQYEWRVGKSHLLIRRAGRKVAAPMIATVMDMTPDEVERAQFKGYLHIVPQKVAEYIKAYDTK